MFCLLEVVSYIGFLYFFIFVLVKCFFVGSGISDLFVSISVWVKLFYFFVLVKDEVRGSKVLREFMIFIFCLIFVKFWG